MKQAPLYQNLDWQTAQQKHAQSRAKASKQKEHFLDVFFFLLYTNAFWFEIKR